MEQRFEFQIPPEYHKTRLEDFLLDRFRALSKMYLRETIKNERCEVNGRHENRGYILKTSDFVEIEINIAREHSMKPEDVTLDIVFEDGEVLVVNKPSGMLVHPTHWEKNGTLLNALTFHLNKNPGEFIRPGLIHRLDKGTSGLLAIAKTPHAHRVLADHFHRKLIEKRYLALVEGRVEDESGTIVAPIARYPELKTWDIHPEGKYAETRFTVLERVGDTTLLEMEPVTGRTNQLRIHCAHVGHPIVGDHRYKGRDYPRLCLHAWKLSFWHPNGNHRLKLETGSAEKIFC